MPELFPYQEEGRDFLRAHPRGGLFDEMGLGKSAQAIAAIDALGLTRGVIVCPASVRGVWLGEIKKFSDRPRKVLKGLKSEDLKLWLRGRTDILVTSYEMATKWKKELSLDLRDFTIFDESHALKNAGAQRTRAALSHQCDGAYGYAKWGAYTWMLSGTPMANDPSDIWTWLRYCQATRLTLRQFADRYFTVRTGSFNANYSPRKETLPELKTLIREHSLRRTKEQVGLEIPPIWITTQVIEGDTREVTALLAEHPGLDEAVMDAVNKGGLKFLEAGHMATLRRLVGEAKAPVFAKQLVDEIEGGLEKVVVFFAHTKALNIFAQALKDSGIGHAKIDGSVGAAQRDEAIERFQTDPDCKVFLGNIVAAGTGLTLTAAAEIVMLESSWVPADNAQALMRVHRIGQSRNVHARFISLANSIDEDVSRAVSRKTAAIIAVEE